VATKGTMRGPAGDENVLYVVCINIGTGFQYFIILLQDVATA
jgi:hypothetical protein